MEKLTIDDIEYQVKKILESDNKTYYYTLDENNDNEVVIFVKDGEEIEKVDEREYPILMNMFSIK